MSVLNVYVLCHVTQMPSQSSLIEALRPGAAMINKYKPILLYKSGSRIVFRWSRIWRLTSHIVAITPCVAGDDSQVRWRWRPKSEKRWWGWEFLTSFKFRGQKIVWYVRRRKDSKRQCDLFPIRLRVEYMVAVGGRKGTI